MTFLFTLPDAGVWIFWTLIICGFFLLMYIGGSSALEREVVISLPVTNDMRKGIVSADQVYHLPVASLTVTATAKVQIARSAGQINSARLVEIQLDARTTIEADTRQLILLNYREDAYSHDELRVTVSAEGLMETLDVTTDDRIGAILSAINPVKMLTTDFLLPKEVQVIEEVVDRQTIQYVQEFRISAEELETGKFTRNWILNVDGTSKSETTCNASFSCSLKPRTLALLADRPSKGILTRPLYSLPLKFQMVDPSFGQREGYTLTIRVPDPSLTVSVPVYRSPFVKRVHQPKFKNGLLVENYINKPSEFEGFVQIPVNILNAIFSIPAQLFNFKITQIKKEQELESARTELERLRKERKTDGVQDKPLSLEEVPGKLNPSGRQRETEQMPNRDSEQQRVVHRDPTHAIIQEAINKNQAFWKVHFNVEDVGVGTKITAGEATGQLCLVFGPQHKLKAGDGNFVPIPPRILYESIEGESYIIPTDVQETGGAIEAMVVVDPDESCEISSIKLPGCSISRVDNQATGTIGLKVYRGRDSYILSCYHVLCANELERGVKEFDSGNPAGSPRVVSPGLANQGFKTELGYVVEGHLTDRLDTALAKLEEDLVVAQRICRTDSHPSRPLEIKESHAQAQYPVYMSGRTSGLKKAKIIMSGTSADIRYSIGKRTVHGLIATTSLARKGDSGAVVFDDDCAIIGIVVAASPAKTYILPIGLILFYYQVTLNPQ